MINARQATDMHCVSTKFGIDSSSRFSFRARTYRQTNKVADATDHPTHASATAGVGNDLFCVELDVKLNPTIN